MNTPMDTAAARAAVAAVALWAGLSSVAHAATRIVDVRFGAHAEFDRLVIEVEGELRAYHQPVRAGEVLVLELNAVPHEAVEVFDTALARMGRVQIEGVADGALVRIHARPGRVRAFTLAEPTRVVVDFANPGDEPLPIPEGATRLLEAIAPPWARAAPAEPEPRATPTPGPRPPVGKVQPAPGPAAGPSGGWDTQVLAWSLATVAIFGALALGVTRLRRRPPTREEPALASSPDTITPEDLGRPTMPGGGPGEDRLLALESRLDNEVRSRTRVEDRLVQLQEDMKVVRDRLRRLARRDPGSGE